MDEEKIFEEREELPEEKIAGMEAMVDQMERMIAENHRMIALGDDVEGRENMIKHLTREISVNNARIKKIKEENDIA